MVIQAQIDEVKAVPARFPQSEYRQDIAGFFNNEKVQSQDIHLLNGSTLPTIDMDNGIIREVHYIYQTVDGHLIDNPVGKDYQDLVKYCAYPGEKMMKKTKLQINGAQIDDYDDMSYVCYRNF